jgi:TPR repeat protein
MTRPSRFDMAMIVGGLAVSALAFIVVASVPRALQTGSPEATVTEAVAALDARHYHTARRMLDPLATAGNADAETWLGYMDQQGLGADRNVAQAITWYNKASSSGSAEADRNLGRIYLDGSGVLQNVATARQWLQLAADRGDAPAQRMLGELFMRGVGVTKDPAQAYAWLAIAASKGDAMAEQERDALLPSLPPSTMSHAEDLEQQMLASIAAPPAAKS